MKKAIAVILITLGLAACGEDKGVGPQLSSSPAVEVCDSMIVNVNRNGHHETWLKVECPDTTVWTLLR